MSNGGFIKIWRKIQDEPWYKRPAVCHLAIHLILNAAHKKHTVVWNNQEVTVRKGQLITSRKILSNETGLSEQQCRTALGCLDTCQFLTSKSTNRFSMITICNYDKYQGINFKSNQKINQQLTSKQPAESSRLFNTKSQELPKNVKKEKKILYNNNNKEMFTRVCTNEKRVVVDKILLKKLLCLGIPQSKAAILIKKNYNNTSPSIEDWLRVIEEKKPNNPAGYLIQALTEKWKLPERLKKNENIFSLPVKKNEYTQLKKEQIEEKIIHYSQLLNISCEDIKNNVFKKFSELPNQDKIDPNKTIFNLVKEEKECREKISR